MPKTVVAADENVETTYLRRLSEVLGAKGLMLLVVVPVALGLSAVASNILSPVVVGVLLTLAFVGALVADSMRDPESKVDTVGLSLVVVVAGHTLLLLTEVSFNWTYAVGGAGLILGTVAYEYLSKGGDGGMAEIHETDVDPLHLDIVGFVTAEILVVYAVLHSTGWSQFANSAVFVILAYIIYVSTVAAFAGYAVITKEIVISRTADMVHEALASVLEDISSIEDDDLREKLALNLRRVAECLDGVRIPTKLEDQYGRVPAVVSTRKPDLHRIDMEIDDVVKLAKKAGFTGYVIHDEDVLLFSNGELAKYYIDGRYKESLDRVGVRVGDASFYELEYPTVKDFIDITPDEGDIVNPKRVKKQMQDKEVEGGAMVGQNLNIGGQEVDVNDMFSLTEELVEESSKEEEESDGKLSVGGDEIDVDELMDRADDVIEDLSE